MPIFIYIIGATTLPPFPGIYFFFYMKVINVSGKIYTAEELIVRQNDTAGSDGTENFSVHRSNTGGKNGGGT